MIDPSLAGLADHFERAALHQADGYAPLYARLWRGAAADEDILRLAKHTRRGVQPSNALLAAAHYLLMDEPDDPLARWYADIRLGPMPDEDPWPAFRAFCLAHEAGMAGLLATRMVQTNEVSRCATLVPGLLAAAKAVAPRPLALIDVGSSAGLHLLFDRFAYRYSDGQALGPEDAPLVLRCEVRGDVPLPRLERMPVLASRVGIDLHPVQLDDADGLRWLRALIWPEHAERRQRFEAAVAVALREPPPLVEGDALEALPRLVRDVPEDIVPLVHHAHAMAHMPPEVRIAYAEELLPSLGAERDLLWLACEGHEMRLTSFLGGVRTDRMLAHRDMHGAWIEWRDEA